MCRWGKEEIGWRKAVGVASDLRRVVQVLPAAGWTLLKRCRASLGIDGLRSHTNNPCDKL